MSFIKPLSIEQIFAKFNTNGGEEIDEQEANNAKNINIFQGFKVEKGMKLEDFERENAEIYRQYEESNSEGFAKNVLDNELFSRGKKEQVAEILKEIANNTLERAKRMSDEAAKNILPFGFNEE